MPPQTHQAAACVLALGATRARELQIWRNAASAAPARHVVHATACSWRYTYQCNLQLDRCLTSSEDCARTRARPARPHAAVLDLLQRLYHCSHAASLLRCHTHQRCRTLRHCCSASASLSRRSARASPATLPVLQRPAHSSTAGCGVTTNKARSGQSAAAR